MLYPCNICNNNVNDNNRVICPFCSVEICESCLQYSIKMDLKNPCCIYCKKSLSLEFVLENNDTNWCKTIFIPFFENLCLEKEKSYLIDTMPKYKKMVEIREIKTQIKNLPSNKKIETELLKEFSTDSEKVKLVEIKKDNNFIKLLNYKFNEKKEMLTIFNNN